MRGSMLQLNAEYNGGLEQSTENWMLGGVGRNRKLRFSGIPLTTYDMIASGGNSSG